MKGSIFRHPSPLPVGVSSGYVMTVLGPLPINEMGVTLMHEHILLDASGKWVPPCCCSDRHLAEMPVKMENLGELSLNPLMSRDNCQLFDVDVAIDELTKYRALGGETVVDPTNIGIGRDPKALARIARLTGLNIIMGTGLYLEPSHPEWVKISSVEQLTERLIYDLDDGYIQQILLSQDVFLKTMLTRYGGHGYGYILKHFVPRLRRHGVSGEQLETLMIGNPQRVFGG